MRMSVPLTEVGFSARRAIDTARAGRVAAVFERSAYVEFDSGWVCFARAEAGIGPLNATFRRKQLSERLCDVVGVGDHVKASVAGIAIGPILFVSVASRTWCPPPVKTWTARTLARGLDGLRDSARNLWPDEGLGRFVDNLDLDARGLREAKAAARPIADLYGWLVRAFAGDAVAERPPRSVLELVGLGPGLTPSGDDFLGGAMIAAHALGRGDVAARLYAALAPHARHATHPISRAHLAAAAEGTGGAPLHAGLTSLLAGRVGALPDAMAAIARIGHSSGWDALAGATLALRAWVRQP